MVEIIFEDNKILVVNKPVGIPVQADSSLDPDFLTILKNDLKVRYNKPGNVYLGLVHRLDRGVGGVMVFAKNSKSAAKLSEQIREHTFKKTYLAVVEGKLGSPEGELRDSLLKDTSKNFVKVVEKGTPFSKEAILTYKVLESKNSNSLVQINLKTGRPHQIRVQFANIGNPLVGDQKYGKSDSKRYSEPQLWAYKLKFIHPGTKQEVEFKSTPPANTPWNLFSKYPF